MHPRLSAGCRGEEIGQTSRDFQQEADLEAYLMDHEWSGKYDIDILKALKCYGNFPNMTYPEQNPLSYEYLHEQPQADKQLLALKHKHS